MLDVASLGAALAWADRHGVVDLHVMVDPDQGNDVPARLMARRAGTFRAPPTVWSVVGRDLVRAEPAVMTDPAGTPPAEAGPWFDLLVRHGAEPVVEHGVLRGDVLGLEVARLVPEDADGWTLGVGVGDHDREARAIMRPDQDAGVALDQVVEAVKVRRRPHARRHPANLLAPERWLRSIVISRPDLAGAISLRALAPPVPRHDLRDRCPAPAAGVDGDGRPVVVVCSTGIDVDLVPSAADSRLLHDPTSRLILVVPDGDDHAVTRRLADALSSPAEVITVGRDWPALAG